MARYELPIEDPTPDLSPTAVRILEAAQRVLARDGFRALTFETIAKEAGENPALIRYHFGSKAGLLTALVDSVLYQEAVELIEQLAAVPAGEERRETLLRVHEAIARDRASYQMFFEIVPHVLRDEELRPHFRRLFEWYRRLDTWALDEDTGDRTHQARSEPLAILTVAMIDGLALQAIADPDLDLAPAFELWRRLVLDCVSSSAQAGDQTTASR
jgi:TetR/AcrR family transcriptional regulator, regulator of biofilm formation and stress response